MGLGTRLLAMVRFEIETVFRRASGLAALGVSLLVGLGAVAVMGWVQQNVGAAAVNDMPLGTMMRYSGADCAGWALSARNFFVLPLLLLLATGSSLAGELRERTLREDLVRAVPRWAVLLAKLVALQTLSAATLLVALLPALLGGMAVFGTDGPTGGVLLGYLASLATDLGIISFGLLASTIVPSVGGVVVSVIMLLLVDGGARLLLWLREQLVSWMNAAAGRPPVETVKLSQLLPGAALDAWQGWSGQWAWEPFAGLAVLIGVSLALALVRLQRLDIA